MELTLNPYALVINTNGTMNFILSDHNNPVKLDMNGEQEAILDQMSKGEFLEYEFLCEKFGVNFVNSLAQNGCFVPVKLDTVSSNSRTNAFFATHNMPEARNKLNSSKVLILGCGGIGTHMAWHMTALGVSKLTLVDFDTVEESNLNRQLLFDRSDIGKIKVDVLKEKLSAINPDMQIDTYCKRISSQKELEEICLSDNYNLIIKALDSPTEFPEWLDNVAEEHKLTYVSGITMRDSVLIGPSHIPGETSYSWNELMGVKKGNDRKVYGTSPSIGMMLYHISDELAIEAYKILTGYGTLKYKDKILCKNVFTNEEHVFGKADSENAEEKKSDNSSSKTVVLSLLLMAVMAVASFSQPWLLAAGAVMAMVLPFFLYKTNKDVVRATFLNSIILSVGVLVMMLGMVDISSVTSMLSSAVMLFSTQSAITLFMCVANHLVHKLIKKN